MSAGVEQPSSGCSLSTPPSACAAAVAVKPRALPLEGSCGSDLAIGYTGSVSPEARGP